ncbi:NUDIX domain-containing protein [Paenibacillus piri]|uniref:NUDIX hydrolase n=1 Tax=Paenibacillus piri TaxID=2547395 RepID=A0A4R5K7S0_9BACL|nr:NUDIX hydrolase [Paenibacillus piri]TDF90581.1 NUDIX hydrolase [Paenibacillus piri]
MDNNLICVRVTGLFIENDEILLVKQNVTSDRKWSLPGGKLECGESLADGIMREMKEETGLEIKVRQLLYVCDLPEADPSVLHITFLLEKTSGVLTLPSNEYESTPIHDVKMVPIHDLVSYGFSEKFIEIVENGFPDAGNYKGHKRNIGL